MSFETTFHPGPQNWGQTPAGWRGSDISEGEWTPADRARLKAYVRQGGVGLARQRMPEFGANRIGQMVRQMGLVKPAPRNLWSGLLQHLTESGGVVMLPEQREAFPKASTHGVAQSLAKLVRDGVVVMDGEGYRAVQPA